MPVTPPRTLSQADKALQTAVRRDDVAAMEEAVQNGADTNCLTTNGENLLYIATMGQAMNAAEWLAQHAKIDSNTPNTQKRTALLAAVEREDYTFAKWLLDYGSNPNHPEYSPSSTPYNKFPYTLPLHTACKKGNEPLVRLLLHYGADPNQRIGSDVTALYGAAIAGHKNICCRLLLAGADPSALCTNTTGTLNIHGYQALAQISVTPALYTLGEKGMNEIFTQLLDGGSDPRETGTRDPLTAHLASRIDGKEPLKIVEKYLSFPTLGDNLDDLTKAALFEPNNDGWCLLDAPSTWHRFNEITNVLAQKGETLTKADLTQTNQEGKPWIERAAECLKAAEVMQYLGKQGTAFDDLIFAAPDRFTPFLQCAIETRQSSKVFKEAVWKGQAPSLIRRVNNALPDEAIVDTPNLNALAIHIERNHVQQPTPQR